MNKNTNSQIIKRLSIAEGHLRKVKKMAEENSYCPDIIHQSQAVQAALKKVDEVIFESHLKTCVLSDMKGSPENKRKLAGEIMEVFKKKP